MFLFFFLLWSVTSAKADPKFLLIGGNSPDSNSNFMELYHPNNPKENKILDIPLTYYTEFSNSELLDNGCEDMVVMAGGNSNEDLLNTTQILIPNLGIAAVLPEMKQPRNNSLMTVLDNIVYQCGGDYVYSRTSCCERFKSGKWEYISSPTNLFLPTPTRHNSVMVACGNSLYIIHTFNTYKMERYSPTYDTWITLMSSVPQTTGFDEGVSAAVIDDHIFICGRFMHFRPFHYQNECFRYNVMKNKWKKIASMADQRYGVILLSAANELYAIGGKVGPRSLSGRSKTVQIYNVTTDRWRNGPELIEPRAFFTGVLLHH